MELMGGWSLVADHELLTTLAARIYRRADELLQTLPEGTFQWVGRAMTRAFVDAWRAPESSVHRQPDAAREEFLATEFPQDVSVERLAWAAGIAAQRFLGRSSEAGPVLRVEAPGTPTALAAVRFSGSEPESADAFTARLVEQRELEADGSGILADALRRTVGQAVRARSRARILCHSRQRGPFPGPYGWLTGVVRVARLETAEATPWALHAGGTAPNVAPLGGIGGGLSVTLIVAPDRVELGLVGTGPFAERGALDRLAGAIAAAV